MMRTKSIEQSIREGDDPEYQLKKRLTALDRAVLRHRRAVLRPGRPLLRRVRLDGRALGVVVHAVFGYRRSRLSGNPEPDEEAVPSMTST